MNKCEACGAGSDNMRSVNFGLSGLKSGNLPVGVEERLLPFSSGSHLLCFDCHSDLWLLSSNLGAMEEEQD